MSYHLAPTHMGVVEFGYSARGLTPTPPEPGSSGGATPAVLKLWYDGTVDESGNPQDISGNGYHGTNYGATSLGAGNGFSFDGLDDYLVPPAGSLVYGNSDRTITARVMVADYTTGYGTGIISYGQNDYGWFELCLGGPSLGEGPLLGQLYIQFGQADARCSSNSVIPLVTETFVAIRYDSLAQRITVFKNGQKQSFYDSYGAFVAEDGALAGELVTEDYTPAVGYSRSLGDYFNGVIKDFRVYDTALTDEQILILAGY
jgi:hypothetical protein